MLMDMFFRIVPVHRKRRAHFHTFMLDVHERIHAIRSQPRTGKEADPIELVAEALFDEAWLLCFDEFSVTDIADAMILGRLFSALWRRVRWWLRHRMSSRSIFTRTAYNRALFLPFIDLISRQMNVLRLDARTDYRLEKLQGQRLFFTPNDAAARAALDGIWGQADRRCAAHAARGSGAFTGDSYSRRRLGRRTDELRGALRPATHGGRLSCDCKGFSQLHLDDIPVMTASNRNEASASSPRSTFSTKRMSSSLAAPRQRCISSITRRRGVELSNSKGR